jgi:hypothetical protein
MLLANLHPSAVMHWKWRDSVTVTPWTSAARSWQTPVLCDSYCLSRESQCLWITAILVVGLPWHREHLLNVTAKKDQESDPLSDSALALTV